MSDDLIWLNGPKAAHENQDTNEWLEWRRQGLGASDLPIIMGVSPWATPLQLYFEKVGEQPRDPAGYAAERGKMLEPIARERYIQVTGREIAPIIAEHEVDTWARCSLDGWYEKERGGVEIKCPGEIDHAFVKQHKRPPDKYMPQLWWQFFVTGAAWIDYFSYFVPEGSKLSEGKAEIVRLLPDAEKISEVYFAAKDFWHNHVEARKPPPLTDRDVLEIDDKKALTLAKNWREAKIDLDMAKAREEKLRKDMQKLCEIHPKVLVGPVSITKTVRRGVIDYKAIPDLEDVDLENYRKPDSITFRLQVKE